jgi:hypothetical protein
MPPESDILLDTTPETAQQIASRLARKHRRKYRTARENGGVRVWRLR